VVELIHKAMKVISAEQLWIIPDCGLKTRAWLETKAALHAMVDAAADLRQRAQVAVET
jgi:5-methyltetrahydropteroyltriglutamate--homocysteine methyltransferase